MKRKIILLAFALFSALAFIQKTQAIPIEDGKYSINVQALHATNPTPSMMAGFLDSIATVEVKNRLITACVKLFPNAMGKGTLVSYMKTLTDKGNNTYTEGVSVLRDTNIGIQIYNLPILNLEDSTLAKLFVSLMGMEVSVRLVFDLNSIEDVQDNNAGISHLFTSVADSLIKVNGARYTINVPEEVEKISFTAIPLGIGFGANTDANGCVVDASLNKGNNIFTFTATAADETTKQKYAVKVVRGETSDGLYTMNVRAFHATNPAPSMMSGMLDPIAAVQKKGEQIIASIKFIPSLIGKGTSASNIRRIKSVNDTIYGTSVLRDTAMGIQIYNIEIPNLADSISVQVFVGAMNTWMSLRLVFDENSLTKDAEQDISVSNFLTNVADSLIDINYANFNYTITVPNNIDKISFRAIPSIIGFGAQTEGGNVTDEALKVGENTFTFAVTSVDGVEEQEYTIKITRQNTNNIYDLNKDEVSIELYPNPATEIAHIRVNGNMFMELYSLTGERIVAQKFHNTVEIPVYNFPKGIYIIRLVSERGEVFTRKLIVR